MADQLLLETGKTFKPMPNIEAKTCLEACYHQQLYATMHPLVLKDYSELTKLCLPRDKICESVTLIHLPYAQPVPCLLISTLLIIRTTFRAMVAGMLGQECLNLKTITMVFCLG